MLIILGIFSGLGAKITGGIVAMISTIGVVKKWALIADKAAKFVAKWTKTIYVEIQEHSCILLDISNASQLVDDAINADAKINYSTLKEAIDAGKKVVVKLQDAVMEFKPQSK